MNKGNLFKNIEWNRVNNRELLFIILVIAITRTLVDLIINILKKIFSNKIMTFLDYLDVYEVILITLINIFLNFGVLLTMLILLISYLFIISLKEINITDLKILKGQILIILPIYILPPIIDLILLVISNSTMFEMFYEYTFYNKYTFNKQITFYPVSWGKLIAMMMILFYLAFLGAQKGYRYEIILSTGIIFLFCWFIFTGFLNSWSIIIFGEGNFFNHILCVDYLLIIFIYGYLIILGVLYYIRVIFGKMNLTHFSILVHSIFYLLFIINLFFIDFQVINLLNFFLFFIIFSLWSTIILSKIDTMEPTKPITNRR